MNFRESDNVDFTNVPAAKIKRENNFKDFKSAHDIDVLPKFGEGSQYGKEQKDEARRKKYGIRSKKYNPYDQPWMLTLGNGKEARRFRGTKCKDLMDNASYFAFVSESDGTFTAMPIDEWTDFKYIPKYKTLTIEEAEEEFNRRDKVHNQYAIMLNKRLKDEAGEAEEGEAKMPVENNASNDDESDEEAKKTSETKKKTKKIKKEKGEGSGEEEGEFDEGKELDYISDDSSNEDEKREEEEEDLKGMDSDEEEDEKEEQNNTNNSANNKDSDSSDTSSDSDIDNDPHLPIVVKNNNNNNNNNNSNNKKNTTAVKRSNAEVSTIVPNKKLKMESSGQASIQPSNTSASNSSKASQANKQSTDRSSYLEKQVRRYLMRKPMTSKDLIHKLRKTCSTREQLMDDIVAVLMKLNPSHTTVNDKLYFTLKPTANNEEDTKTGE